jgi:hypothetical protein
MNILTADQITAILRSGKLEDLIGAAETIDVEFKVAPYQLEQEYAKQELAKDVTALANSAGGIIVIGAATEPDPTHPTDKVITISPFLATLIQIQRYYDLIHEWTYPPVEGVEVRWFPAASDAQRGLASIRVPQASLGNTPHFTTRFVSEEGKLSTLVFGYFERKRAGVQHKSVQQIHSVLRAGSRNVEISDQLESIFAALAEIRIRVSAPAFAAVDGSHEGDVSPQSFDKASPEQLSSGKNSAEIGNTAHLRFRNATVAAELAEKPVFGFVAFPLKSTTVPELFKSQETSVVQLLSHPPKLRSNGFDLETDAGSAKNIQGKLRRAGGKNKGLEFWRDGMLVFVGQGGRWFLSWPPNYQGNLALNAMVLAEASFLFARLLTKLLDHMEPKPSHLGLMTFLDNLNEEGRPAVLRPEWRHQVPYVLTGGPEAPDKGAAFERTVSSTLSEGRIAFELLAPIYEWFSIDHDRIPYTEPAEDGSRAVTVDAFLPNDG